LPSHSFTSENFLYDGDGKRVKSIITMSNGSTTTYFVGSHYEVVETYTGTLGSTSLTTDANGQVISEMRYKAWGETRYASGSTPTKYQYTGQYSYAGDFGLMFYNARWYDSSLSRFAQADTIIPAGVQGYDRYAYSNNNPIRYTDPTGHEPGACQDSAFVNGSYVCNPTPTDKGLKAYVQAGINVQNPTGIIRGQWVRDNWGVYTGVGPAKVTDKQMETLYGEIVKDENENRRGVGLGLREPGSCTPTYCSPDQLDPDVANLAMELRISLRTNVCENHGCTATDIFIVAALAENESIYPDDIKRALKNDPAADGPTTINWNKYLEEEDPNNYVYNHGLIVGFTAEVLELQEKGWYVPGDIDWDYIYNLISPPSLVP
jgi:RHS repeat-associated protein